MPMYEYVCTFCGCQVEKLQKSKEPYPRCPQCTAFCDFVPSIPAWRPDKTVRGY